MFSIWAYSLLGVSVVSLVSLIGVFALAMRAERLNRMLFYLVSFSVGALLGDVFIHILPEIAEEADPGVIGTYMLVGIIAFFVLERFVLWHHSHTQHSEQVHSVVYLTIIGDALHNFLDGVAIAASFLVSIPVGIATTIAVVFHEIPQEIGQFAILLHGGWSVKKSLLYNFLSAVASIAGAVLVLLLAARVEEILVPLLAVSAASFIYIALSDLIPELNREPDAKKSVIQLVWMLVGVGVMAALLGME
jgi:zinc and cadmium transporter